MQASGEHFALICGAVRIVVLENQQFVIHRRLGFPVRIGRHRGDPKPALVIKV